jgi:hypothetical protein
LTLFGPKEVFMPHPKKARLSWILVCKTIEKFVREFLNQLERFPPIFIPKQLSLIALGTHFFDLFWIPDGFIGFPNEINDSRWSKHSERNFVGVCTLDGYPSEQPHCSKRLSLKRFAT